MQKFDWEAGKIFGRLMLTGKSYYDGRRRYVETICDCRTVKWIRFDAIKSGAISSCGCYHSESARKQLTTHGLSGHYLYTTHEDMKARCYNTVCESYPDYGERGIIVCDEWKDNFKAFHDWAIVSGWFEGCDLTLDRIDNDGNYEPLNCRFSTDHIQARNKRSNVNLVIFNETKCMTDWSFDIRCKVELGTFATRIRRGWDVELALITTSKIPQNKRKRYN